MIRRRLGLAQGRANTTFSRRSGKSADQGGAVSRRHEQLVVTELVVARGRNMHLAGGEGARAGHLVGRLRAVLVERDDRA